MKDRFNRDVISTDEDSIMAMRSNDSNGAPIESEPTHYAIWDEKFQFNVAMDAARAFTLVYYKQPAELSASSETNWLTSRYPHLLMAACRYYAEIFTKNFKARDEAMRDMERILATVAVQDDLTYRGFVPNER